MLIKQADDKTPLLNTLKQRIEVATAEEKERLEIELRRRSAGMRGEQNSAYFIDFSFADSPNWMVLHDLRLESDGRKAQIDHLLINRFLECYVLETKQFHAWIRINEHGEFERWNSYRNVYQGMESPLLQAERHAQVLDKVMQTLALPTRFGKRISPTFKCLVLVAPKARILRQHGKQFDSGRVIKADQLRQRIDREFDENPLVTLTKAAARLLSAAARLLSSETIESLARQLAAHHAPLQPSHFPPSPADIGHPPESISSTPLKMVLSNATQQTALSTGFDAPEASFDTGTSWPASILEPATGQDDQSEPVQTTPVCRQCGGSKGLILYKHSYFFRCDECNGNTSIRFQCLPDHQPRLRKQGKQFFRDCAQCGTSSLYFENAQ